MLFPSSFRFRAAVAVAILGLVALLSCQNDVTAPSSSTKVVSGHWNPASLRMPDSAAWALHDTTGTFALTTSTKDTSFTVQAILPRTMAPQDTLALSLFTLSLRTTLALCKADANGNLSLWVSGTHDPLAAHLLQVLDSLQKKSPTVWGAKTDSIAAQIRSLQKLYATLVLSKDATLQGFPASHPFGIDTLAVIDQILILATQQKLTLHGLDSLVSSLASLDSAKVHKEAQKLGVAGKIDTLVLFPAPVVVANQPPSFSGVANLTVTASAMASSYPNWINAISSGPANESGQKVAFEVQVVSGQNLFSITPVVDGSGTLTFTGTPASSGVATIQVRAHDNGDSTTAGSVNVSAWKSASIQFVARAVLAVPGTGPSDTISLVEDSTVTVAFTAQNFLGSSLAVKLVPADTTIVSALSATVKPDNTGRFSFQIHGKTDAFGGPVLASLSFADSLDTISTVAYVRIAPRNRAPSFLGAANLSVVAISSPSNVPNWVASISAGPANESSQKVSFEVQVLNGQNLFSIAPVVDSSGTLTFTGASTSSGTATIQVRAHDNGDSTVGSSVNTSAWKNASIQFTNRPVLAISGIPSPIALVEDSTTALALIAQNFSGSSLTIRFVPSDSSWISNGIWSVKPDTTGKFSIALGGRTDSAGGPISGTLSFIDARDSVPVAVFVKIAPRNRAPSFSGAANLSATAGASASNYPNWITSISAGPANESGQKVAFEVQVVSGQNLFSITPVVDGSGTLTFTGTPASSGVASIQVRAHDNGDSTTAGSVNASAWKIASIQFVARAVLAVPGTGPSDTIALVEDSTVTVAFTAQNFLGSSLAVKLVPADTTSVSAQSWKVKPDNTGRFTFQVQGKSDAFCGPTLASLSFADSLDTLSTVAYVRIAPRNRAPSFLGAMNLSVVASASPSNFSNWITSISAGPANESNQKVSFEAQVLSGATLFSVPPVVDGLGNLSFTGKSSTPGTATIQVRAHDNGDSTTGSSLNTSAWKSASIVFDVPASLGLTSRTVATWQGYAISDTANLYWGGGNSSNLVVGWSASDSTLLPRGSVVFPATGSQRFFQMTPAPGKWGIVTVRFTVTDSLGGVGTDSLTLVVQPVNHAPVLALKGNSFLATTWKGDPTLQVAGAPTWDDATTVQKGRIEVKWLNSQDSLNYLTSLRVDPTGVLHFSASVDTSVAIQFQLRAHDSSGTAHGGVDTSAWSSTITLQLVDTVKDVDGNSYRARRMPDGKVWMRQNLYTKPRNGDTAYSCAGGSSLDNFRSDAPDCPKRGALYKWSQTMALDPTCDTLAIGCVGSASKPQGLCPSGWHLAQTSEWTGLFLVTMSAGDSDSTINLRGNDSGWAFIRGQPIYGPGSGKFGDFIVPTEDVNHYGSLGTIFWLPSVASGTGPSLGNSLMIWTWQNTSNPPAVGVESTRPATMVYGEYLKASARCVLSPQ